MKKIELNTNLARGIFGGIYGTFWDLDGFEEQDDDGNLLEYGVDYEIDFREYMQSILSCYQGHTDMILNILVNGLGLTSIKGLKFVDTFSPKEYNFKNDQLDFEIKVDAGFHMQLIGACRNLKGTEEFEKYLHDHFTSRDGFWSFTPNNIVGIEIALDDETDEYEQSVGACLSYLLEDKELEQDIYFNDGGCCVYEAIKYLKSEDKTDVNN